MAERYYHQGLEIRRQVLGDKYVDKALAESDEFTRPLQDLITEYCWGQIWGRPGLDVRTRSMLNIAIMIALNRSPELKIHLRGALNNGVTKDEIKEIILQTAVYCGIPAALEAMSIAKQTFAEPWRP
jgi:4-carboxymuconolactone decarboxylase